jgi:hypothetical protein
MLRRQVCVHYDDCRLRLSPVLEGAACRACLEAAASLAKTMFGNFFRWRHVAICLLSLVLGSAVS